MLRYLTRVNPGNPDWLVSRGHWTLLEEEGKPAKVMLCCPNCGKRFTLQNPILSEEPLTLEGSTKCPRGCHFYIKEGVARGV